MKKSEATIERLEVGGFATVRFRAASCEMLTFTVAADPAASHPVSDTISAKDRA
jgi:hypothetical protein